AEQVGCGMIDAVALLRRPALAGKVEGLGGFLLHAECQFKRSDPGVEDAVDDPLALVELIELAERIELGALPLERAGGITQVGNRLLQIADECSLIGAGKETR